MVAPSCPDVGLSHDSIRCTGLIPARTCVLQPTLYLLRASVPCPELEVHPTCSAGLSLETGSGDAQRCGESGSASPPPPRPAGGLQRGPLRPGLCSRAGRRRSSCWNYWVPGPGGHACAALAENGRLMRAWPGRRRPRPDLPWAPLSCRCVTPPPVPSAGPLSCSASSTLLEKWPSAWTLTVGLGLSCGASAGERPPHVPRTTGRP